MPRLASAVVAASLGALAAPLASAAAPADTTATVPAPDRAETAMPLTLERIFASPALTGAAPRGVKLSPDGRYLTVLRPRTSDKDRYDLWAYERATGQWRMLVDSEALSSGRALSEAERMQRERLRIGSVKGIASYGWTPDGQALLVPLDGDLYLARLDGSTVRLTASPDGALNPAISQTGRYVSFARGGRLYVGEVGGEARPVTPAETSAAVGWGVAEFVAQEELARLEGYWWSPDDSRIAVQRTDETPVAVVARTAIGAETTTVTHQRYPAAGTDNAEVRLFVMDPDGGNRVEVPLGAAQDYYLARVDWAKDGGTLYVQRLTRRQDRLDMLAVDPATGQARVLFSETAAAGHWINVTDSYRWLGDGSLVWWSERSGFGHLYRYADGAWTALTRGDWVVTALAGVDEQAGRAVFAANRDDPLSSQLFAVDFAAPGALTRLTDPAFVNHGTMDRAGRALIVRRSNAGQPPQSYLADAAGTREAWIEENAVGPGHPLAPYLPAFRPVRYGTLQADDGQTLHYSMIVPAMAPGKRYPVLFVHYGGPHVQTVTKAFGDPLDQVFAARGYIVFALDNRGSWNRGVAFEQPIHRAMGGVEVADQRRGAEYLKSLPFVDPARIATYGWSYGGYLTLKMLEADPGLYAAGIAGAPVAAWEQYDTAYTERYMGDPRTGKAAYDKAGTLADAGRIADPLLLIHGMSDDNVVLANTTAMAARLQAADVPFEMMLYPGETHSAAHGARGRHVWATILAFLARHGVVPPE